jgi:integrase
MVEVSIEVVKKKGGKKAPVPCTKAEMDSLINAAIENEFFYMFFKVARKTGRRLGEYYQVQVKDVNLEQRVMITKILKRRARIEKEAILDDELVMLIKRYILKEHLKLDDYLFRKVSYRQIQNRVEFYAKKAGIPHKVSFHNFRHFFVTSLFKQGWDYAHIAKLTGHSSPGTLVNYDSSVAADVADEAREAMQKL